MLLRDRLGNWTYQFAAAVDDLHQGVDLVIRGRDLLESTGRQIYLAALLGRTQPPVFMHHPLIMKSPEQKLSKSDGDTGHPQPAGRRPDGAGDRAGSTGRHRLTRLYDGRQCWRWPSSCSPRLSCSPRSPRPHVLTRLRAGRRRWTQPRGRTSSNLPPAWRAAQKGRPNDPALMYLLAWAQSLSGRPGDALVMLRRIAELGVPTDAAENDDFRRVRVLPGWAELEARIAAVAYRRASRRAAPRPRAVAFCGGAGTAASRAAASRRAAACP